MQGGLKKSRYPEDPFEAARKDGEKKREQITKDAVREVKEEEK